MARRRGGDDGGSGFDEFVDEDDPSFGGGFGSEAPLRGGPIGTGDFILGTPPPSAGTPRPGPIDPDMDNALRGIFAKDGGEVAGNTDTARDLRPRSNPNIFGLPQGVSVNESMGGGGDYSQDAPAMPTYPDPAAGRPANPVIAPTQPTRRVSAAPSALFGQEGSSTMFGRAGGLLGGGQGVVGAGQDGEIDPTEMMKKLLEGYQRG